MQPVNTEAIQTDIYLKMQQQMAQYEIKRNKNKYPTGLDATKISGDSLETDSEFASNLSIIKEMDRAEETKRVS